MKDFGAFAVAVRNRFKEMAQGKLFEVALDQDTMNAEYLASFPEGSNPIFRVRTEHDCSCCRHFIRDVGNVVTIQNGVLSTVWDLNGLPEPYQTVADAMAVLVRKAKIVDVFLTEPSKIGTTSNFEASESGAVIEWHHFAVEVPKEHRLLKRDLDTKRGELRTTFDVFKRGVTELSADALFTTKELITSGSIYRGEEHLHAVEGFIKLHQRYNAIGGVDPNAADNYLWSEVGNKYARFKPTVIGSLVTDLSNNVELEDAVKMYESKVAPQNYKRSSTLITKAMVQSAMQTIDELGLEGALVRRHAKLSDVSVNSVLFVDNAVQGKMKDGIAGLLESEVKTKNQPDLKAAQEIPIDKFIADILPKVKSMELYLDNTMMTNFVSLTAPATDEPEKLFKWGNNFAWSYDGNVADSIKEKVKKAGGQVEGVTMRASLAWSNHDDLDLHVSTPSGRHICFRDRGDSYTGMLDVDMNAGGNMSRSPVENIRWTRKLDDGIYKVWVHQFCRRESIDVGFTVELETHLGLMTFSRPKMLEDNRNQNIAEITVKKGIVTAIIPDPGVKAGNIAQEKWGLKTLNFAKVNSLVLSPNYWDGAVGNKHWFFILDGCKNPEPTRGFYNEFLKPELEKHRKVFEILGDKTKCPPAAEQLSGVGFSSTKRDKVTVMAMGPSLHRPYTIVF